MFLGEANFLVYNCAGVAVRGLMSVWVGGGWVEAWWVRGAVEGERPAGTSLLQE